MLCLVCNKVRRINEHFPRYRYIVYYIIEAGRIMSKNVYFFYCNMTMNLNCYKKTFLWPIEQSQ